MVFISSHGSVQNGVAMVCLFNCNASQFGNDYSFGPSDMPQPWNGPTWLILAACEAVQPNAGWESLFGNSLHGILGYNNDVFDFTDSAQKQLTTLMIGYDGAIDAWGKANLMNSYTQFTTALVPAANKADAIEAPGGPHYGPNGSINPQYYTWNEDSQMLSVQIATLSSAPTSTYNLVPEAMNESYWYNYYGGTSVPSVTSHPSANEDLYRNQYTLVDHFLASGGLLVANPDTGTAKGFSINEAYQYALSWINSNGGLPGDAALTYAGQQTVMPTSAQSTSDQPYPNVRQYMFTWRHANSAVLGDSISILVDDAGSLTQESIQIGTRYAAGCRCLMPVYKLVYVQPWVPAYHIAGYSRMWRTLGGTVAPQAGTAVRASAYAYCGSDMMAAQSVATPCALIQQGSSTRQVNAMSGQALSVSETVK